MFTITGYLYKNDKLLLYGLWEDLVDFVEELKQLNLKFVDRKDFKILDSEGYIIKQWFRK